MTDLIRVHRTIKGEEQRYIWVEVVPESLKSEESYWIELKEINPFMPGDKVTVTMK